MRLPLSHRRPALLCLVACLLPAPALAQGGAAHVSAAVVPAGPHGSFAMPGSLRLVYSHVGAVDLHSEDEAVAADSGADDAFELRLALQPSLTFGLPWRALSLLRLDVDAEVVAYPVASEIPSGLDLDPVRRYRDRAARARLMAASLTALGPHAALTLGLVRSHAGLGMVAHGGRPPDPTSVRSSPWGFERTADRVARFQIVAFPFGDGPTGPDGRGAGLTLLAAADAVIADDTASWAEGDRSWQVWGGAAFRHADTSVGVGALHRRQDHAEGGDTRVWVVLGTARYEPLVGEDRLYFEAEGAVTAGGTSFARSAIREGRYEILTAGAVARLGGGHGPFDAVLESGFASGDDNPYDAELHTFRFDREYRVGLLLFGEVLRATTALAAHELADESFRATPTRGFDEVASEGAVQNALYLNPRVAWRPLPGLALTLGYLYAVTDEPWADPVPTALAGGEPRGPRGAPGARVLGHEIDAGVDYHADAGPVRLRIGAQVGWLRPGSVFDDAAGERAADVIGAWGHGEVRW